MALLISAPAWRGSGASFAKIAAGLARAGHTPVLITSEPAVTARFSALGLPARQIPLRRTGWDEVRRLGALLRQTGAGLILADSPRDVRLAALATFPRRVPLIFRYNLSGRSLPGDPVSRLLLGRISLVVYQSEYARERALRTSPWLARKPSRQIPNGYDGTVLRPDAGAGMAFRRQQEIRADQPVVLSGAALYRDKGYSTAILALARLVERVPLTWLVAGEGEERAALEAEARRHQVPARFLGSLSQETLAAVMNAADVVLHPAPGELFPNLVAEAMALERAVVAVDSGATPELLGRDGAAGRLVPADDPSAMAQALESLLQSASTREWVGRIARRRLLDRFPLERMERSYQELVEQITGGAGLAAARPPVTLATP